MIALTRTSSNLEQFSWSRDVEVIEMDICSGSVGHISGDGSSGLIHLAWGDLRNFNAASHYENWLPNSYEFIKRLCHSGVENVLVAGTCLEYGPQPGELAPDANCSPTTAYGYAKNSLRHQLAFLQQSHEFSLKWGRIFYMFGQGQSDGSLIAQLDRAIECREEVFNMSAGDQLRDYLPVTAAAKQLVDLYESDKNIVANVCSGTPISVRALVEAHIKRRKSDIKLNLGYFPYPEYEPMAFWGKVR